MRHCAIIIYFIVIRYFIISRNYFIKYIISKKYPASHINCEKVFYINKVQKRYDIVVYNSSGEVEILVECKSPDIKINNDHFDQVMRYNIELKSKKARLNYEIIQQQVDSVRSNFNSALNGVAANNDNVYNLSPAFNIKRIPSSKVCYR